MENTTKGKSDLLLNAGRLLWESMCHLLWPAMCTVCGKDICQRDKGLCQDCWQELAACTGADYCKTCGRDASPYGIVNGRCPDCTDKKFEFDKIARTGIYAGTLRKLILSFKSNQRTELDNVFGQLAKSAIMATDFCDKIDYFVPVPLHWSRKFLRGYNQSELIAKKLTALNIPLNKELVRIRRTRPQPLAMTPKKRAANVANAFAVREGHNVAGKNICLIDDIKTTGTTLNECARTLKAAGASNVYAFVLAVAAHK